MEKDYRLTSWCEEFKNIIKQKQDLKNYINDNTKIKHHYAYIKKKGSYLYNEFSKIYNHKCGYCGVNLFCLNRKMFEIDHYICESSFKKVDGTIDNIKAGDCENLVLACYGCNRGKADFLIGDEYKNLLNPDGELIKEVFFRDGDFSIKIKKDYLHNRLINEFFVKMKFDSFVRQLDFLLMEIDGLISTLSDGILRNKLLDALRILIKKRNSY